MELSFTLNGEAVTHDTEPKRPAVDVLREDFGLTSLKPGCSPQGICGSCAAELGGKFRLTCTLPFKSLAGKEVRTLEGLSEADRSDLAGAFEGATLCAYGTPGLVAHAALLGDGDVGRALHMHSCRAAWSDVREAVSRVGQGLEAGDEAVALGEHVFVGDLSRPGMLHGALVFPPIACGRVRVDASALEGGTFYGPGQLGMRLDGMPLLTDQPESAGQPVGLVVAETRVRARALAASVVVDVVTDKGTFDAEASRVVVGSARDEDGNPLEPMVRSTSVALRLSPTDPGNIEPEGALAVPTLDGLSVFCNGACAGLEQEAAAAASGLSVDDVLIEIIGPAGLLGGRQLPLVTPYAAAAARRLDRPVKLCLGLEEGMAMHARRHGCTLELTLGCSDEGRFTHLVVEVDADAGFGGESEGFCARVVTHASGAYAIPNRSVSARAMETNNPPAGEVLGDGAIQVGVALELAVDQLAEELGIDPVELRRLNLAEDCRAQVEALLAGLAGSIALAVARRVSEAPALVGLSDDGDLLLDRSVSGLPDALVCSDAPRSPSDDAELIRRALEGLGEGEVGEASAAVGEVVGVCAAQLRLNEQGAVEELHVRASGDHGQRYRALAAAGLGYALTERLDSEAGHVDARLRNIGLIKARDLPEIRLEAFPSEGWNRADTAILMAAPAATAAAVRRFEGATRPSWPMNDSEAAYSVGVRRPRKKR